MVGPIYGPALSADGARYINSAVKGIDFVKYQTFLLYSQNVIINSENKRILGRVEGVDVSWKLYLLSVVTGEGGGRYYDESRNVVGLFRPDSQIRRYTPVYQCLNEGIQWWL